VLAGGRGTRLGGADKGWIELGGRPLIVRVLERFAPQVDEVVISANRNLEQYAALGYPVIRDVAGGFAGPLAGLQAALGSTRHALLASVPCDCPALPLDLVPRLCQALNDSAADVAVARAAGRIHPVFSLVRTRVLSQLDAFLAAGGHEVERWCRSVGHVEVSFDDQPDAFLNVNTPDDLTAEPARRLHRKER
jgi:molybdenum cofactor guanylyltransferase